MNTMLDDAITEAIQYFGMSHVQRIQHELAEGMRNGESCRYVALREFLGRLEQVPQLTDRQVELTTDRKFIEDLQEVGLAPMLSPTRYMSLLGIDAKTLARNARVTVSAVTRTPGDANIQRYLRNNLRVIKAAYDLSGGDLAKSVHWFRTEPLPMFGHRTPEQMVCAGETDDVVRLIDSFYAGAAG